jgi:branched-chain amino acid transport system permease protein
MTMMFPDLFGGEGGISTNRVIGEPVLGISFGPQIELYYLIALYCFVCTGLMFMFTGTPLGRMLNAVRDNPERVEFVGFNTQLVRYIAFIIAGFFAGIGGGLFALNFELVQGSAVSGLTSAAYLLFTYIGGVWFFFGPIIGAILSVLVGVLLSEITKAWALYLGIVFVLIVMFAPGGLSSIVMMNVRVAAFKKFGRLLKPYLALIVTTPLLVVGGAALVEMLYHRQINAEMNPQFRFFGMVLDVTQAGHWLAAAAVMAVGAVAFELARRYFKRHWDHVQEEIQAIVRIKEAS